jgi:hypothetical protein
MTLRFEGCKIVQVWDTDNWLGILGAMGAYSIEDAVKAFDAETVNRNENMFVDSDGRIKKDADGKPVLKNW